MAQATWTRSKGVHSSSMVVLVSEFKLASLRPASLVLTVLLLVPPLLFLCAALRPASDVPRSRQFRFPRPYVVFGNLG